MTISSIAVRCTALAERRLSAAAGTTRAAVCTDTPADDSGPDLNTVTMSRRVLIFALFLSAAFSCQGGFFAFADPVYLDVGIPQGPVQVATGDLDGDGVLDIATVHDFSLSDGIFFMNGDGTLDQAIVLPLPPRATSDVSLGDADGDSDLDAVYRAAGGVRYVYRNNGDRTFEPPVECRADTPDTLCNVETLPNASPPETRDPDFDGDGLGDELIVDGGAIRTELSGGAQVEVASFADRSVLYVNDFHVDIDADGESDVLAVIGSFTMFAPFQIVTVRGQGDGSFDPPSVQFTIAEEAIPALAPPRLLDINENGSPDLELFLFYSTPSDFHEGTLLVVTRDSGSLDVVPVRTGAITTPADINADGINDLILLEPIVRQTAVRLGLNDQGFGVRQEIGFGLANSSRLASGDFDKDGLVDIAVLSRGPGRVHLFAQSGAGGFEPAVELSALDVYSSADIASGDLDGDGTHDLVFGGSSVGFVPGGGSIPTILATGVAVEHLLVEDINGDGAQDILVFETDGSERILFGNGNGSLIGEGQLNSGGEPALHWPTLVDVDTSQAGSELVYGPTVEMVSQTGVGGSSTTVGSVPEPYQQVAETYSAADGPDAIGLERLIANGRVSHQLRTLEFQDGQLVAAPQDNVLLTLNRLSSGYSMGIGQLGPQSGETIVVSGNGDSVTAVSGLGVCPPGEFEHLTTMSDPGALGLPGIANRPLEDPGELLLTDLNDDGFADLVYTANGSGLVIVRLSDGLFADGFENDYCRPTVISG